MPAVFNTVSWLVTRLSCCNTIYCTVSEFGHYYGEKLLQHLVLYQGSPPSVQWVKSRSLAQLNSLYCSRVRNKRQETPWLQCLILYEGISPGAEWVKSRNPTQSNILYCIQGRQSPMFSTVSGFLTQCTMSWVTELRCKLQQNMYNAPTTTGQRSRSWASSSSRSRRRCSST